MHFTDLGLPEPILKVVTQQGYDTPTPIQAQAIPAIMEGHDVMAALEGMPALTDEEMQREIDFVLDEKPTFDDAIEWDDKT